MKQESHQMKKLNTCTISKAGILVMRIFTQLRESIRNETNLITIKLLIIYYQQYYLIAIIISLRRSFQIRDE